MSSELWIPNSDNWAWFSNHLQHVWSTLVWGAVKRGQPCVAAFKDGRQLRAHRQQCLTHPQFSIVQTNANQATADTVDGLRRNCTRWGMDVDPRREDRIERDGSRDGRWATPMHRPCSCPSPFTFVQFLSIAFPLPLLWFEMPLFAINIPVLWLLLGSRGEANIFFIKPS